MTSRDAPTLPPAGAVTDLEDLTPRQLTPRQNEVAELVAKGLTDKKIAAKLQMKYNTVRVHVVAIAFSLCIPPGQNTRVAIANWWWTHHQHSNEAA